MAALAAPCLFLLVLSHELKPETQIAAQPTAIAFAVSAAPRRPVYESACERRSSGMQIEGCSQGFTLIELSIVLVIIGLIVGGVLVGQDLIVAAATRAQIAQIEKFNSAVNTFYGKYGYLPGDIPNPYAGMFGFQTRGQYAGEGDGNGTIEGIWKNAAGCNWSGYEGGGETPIFWVDLSTAGLIEGGFSTASTTAPLNMSGTSVALFFPQAKIGGGNYVYVWGVTTANGTNNYFGLSQVTAIYTGTPIASTSGLTVSQAYSIDKKIDDGLPQSGHVLAAYLSTINNGVTWAEGGGVSGNPTTSSTPGSPTTCYDNAGVAGQQHYSVEISNGTNLNCALSFQMQGAGR